MTILMTSQMPGVSEDGYRHLADALGPLLTQADGFIQHVAGPTDDGYLVTELWASAETHQRWYDAHVLPAIPAGAPQPVITVREITHVLNGNQS